MLVLPQTTNSPEADECDWFQGHISAKFTQLTIHQVHCHHIHGSHWPPKYRESFPVLLTARIATSCAMNVIVSETVLLQFPTYTATSNPVIEKISDYLTHYICRRISKTLSIQNGHIMKQLTQNMIRQRRLQNAASAQV
jgi:hypothetical protein